MPRNDIYHSKTEVREGIHGFIHQLSSCCRFLHFREINIPCVIYWKIIPFSRLPDSAQGPNIVYFLKDVSLSFFIPSSYCWARVKNIFTWLHRIESQWSSLWIWCNFIGTRASVDGSIPAHHNCEIWRVFWLFIPSPKSQECVMTFHIVIVIPFPILVSEYIILPG